jgi:N-carbamoylputrescine amidase
MVKVAAIQMQMCEDKAKNVANAEKFVREAAENGAQIILLPELFEGYYFCKDKDEKYFSWAQERENHPIIERFSQVAKELQVVLPISYFEKDGERYFNSLVVIDADGTVMENYRKTHIPDGPGYEEKFYFEFGDSGFKVYDTAYCKVGIGICWDQWFSETSRILTLMGADVIFFPTAIGSEPEIKIDSASHWQRVQMGHSAANIIPVIAANRIGEEVGESCSLTFYGSSFVTDHTGEKIAEASRDQQEIIYGEFDFEKIKEARYYWGLIRDRRAECYDAIVKR